ncbi:ChrR family anti-sigma-E factor [Sulfitobacter sp. SK011]|uniref:ChrR family anti-sigma-E factor n=1 Tax=Sulfitobacter sp. SK011 TaxID=1389004 RepID=UPI000E0A68FB|nr:ChrR family anti-sigma-E factor [Sulfitobacter sp. SK011]AXI41003.1 transcriptional regulator [Sulfitobacter sp. SK011]
MTIRHHLDDATLMAYAAGTLPEAFNLAVASHVSLCDECRAAVASCDAVGGVLMDTVEVSDLADESLAHVMARLDLPEAQTPPHRVMKKGTLPGPLQDYVGGDLESIKWRPIGMGVKQAILTTSSEAVARLLYIPAGVAMPDHSHGGNELTLVLQGAFFDEDDRFARGDIEVADGSVTHTPIADIGDDCICLAVTDAPLEFKKLLPRIVQRFVGI